jgi:hypothetical protein
VVVFRASNLLFTVRRASASRHTSIGLWPLISAPTGCVWSIERMCDSRKAGAAMRAAMAHNTITVLGVIDVFGVFLGVERSGIDLFTV